MRNPYDILGIKANATQKQIEKAYDKEVKNAQRNITNEGALETKLSELSWALTELLNENTRDKYEAAESNKIIIKEDETKTKNIVLKYISCICVALFFCIKGSVTSIYSYNFDMEEIIVVVYTAIGIAIPLLGFWLLDFMIRTMFATSEEDYTARNIIRWIVIVLNSIVFLGAIIYVSQKFGGEGFETIGYMIPDVITYAVIIIATFFFIDRANKRND